MRLLSCLLIVALLVPSASAHALQRIALVIGNSAYEHTSKLKNPTNDAKLMAKTLKLLGFEVILQVNASQKTMKRAVSTYLRRIDESGPETIGLVYFAGHGLQVAGENFLIPIDAKIEREGDVGIEAVSASEVLSGMRLARNRLNIIILDACRKQSVSWFFPAVLHAVWRAWTRRRGPISCSPHRLEMWPQMAPATTAHSPWRLTSIWPRKVPTSNRSSSVSVAMYQAKRTTSNVLGCRLPSTRIFIQRATIAFRE